MRSHEVPTRTSVSRVDEHGIIHTTILPGVEETLADAQETIRAVLTIAAGRRLPMVVDIRSLKSQDRDARQYYGSPAVTQAIPAVALLAESRVSMLIANFSIAVMKTKTPTKIFTDETAALAWLKGFGQ